MSSAAEMLDDHREIVGDEGEDIILRRAGSADQIGRARVTGFQPSELGGGIQQGDRRIILLPDGLNFEPPLRKGDKAVVRGRVLNIEFVDDNTRCVGGVLVAYELLARGG